MYMDLHDAPGFESNDRVADFFQILGDCTHFKPFGVGLALLQAKQKLCAVTVFQNAVLGKQIQINILRDLFRRQLIFVKIYFTG